MSVTRSGVSHSKHHPVPHCRVLPPGEFNGMITKPLAVFSETFMTNCNRFPLMLHINNRHN